MELNYFIYNILPKRLSETGLSFLNWFVLDYKHLFYKITVYNQEQTIIILFSSP